MTDLYKALKALNQAAYTATRAGAAARRDDLRVSLVGIAAATDSLVNNEAEKISQKQLRNKGIVSHTTSKEKT